jgi:hypothetical protein
LGRGISILYRPTAISSIIDFVPSNLAKPVQFG